MYQYNSMSISISINKDYDYVVDNHFDISNLPGIQYNFESHLHFACPTATGFPPLCLDCAVAA